MKRAGFLVSVIHRRPWLSVIAGALLVLGAAASRAEDAVKDFHIEAQSATTGIPEFARQAGIQILVSERLVHGKSTSAVMGSMSIEKALERLLQGTGLTAASKDGRTFTLAPAGSTSMQGAPMGGGIGGEGRGMGETASPGVAGTAAAGPSGDVSLGEIIVTAQKREERLQDVPAAVSVVSGEVLLDQHLLDLQDYYATVPGLAITDYGTGGRVGLSMRGLSTGNFGNPTVGITVDDVPIGATNTAAVNGAQYVPQLDPSDIQRIEFLKGPQGTLYGASSIGGVMRYVTVTPNLSSTSGRAELDGDTVTSGGQGFGVRASVNVPLIENLWGLRFSVLDRQEPGYIDDPTHGRFNVNRVDTSGGRIDTLIEPWSMWSFRVTALVERTVGYGDATVDTDYRYQPLRDYYAHDRLPGTGGYQYQTALATGTIKYEAADFTVASITAYDRYVDYENSDFTLYYGAYANAFFPGAFGSAVLTWLHTDKFSEELRFSSAAGRRFEWLIGGFYTVENNGSNTQSIFANELNSGAVDGTLLSYLWHPRYREIAGFADATMHFTESFDLQLGAREGYNSQTYNQDVSGPFQGGTSLLNTRSSDNAFTYLVTPRLRLSPSLMLYARLATGYQAGGPNTPSTPSASIPLVYGPATTTNYEIGAKSDFWDHRLSLDAAAFYVLWSKIQLTGMTANGFTYTFNGGRARSDGVELAMDFRPLQGLTIAGSFAYTNAELTNSAGAGFPGVSGDSLPFSSRYSASLSGEEKVALSSSVNGFVGATVAYVGKRFEGFPASLGEPQPTVPSYTYGNLQGGLEREGYRAALFIKNITDTRGILSSSQFTDFTPTSGIWHTAFITPRTVGVSLEKRF